MMWLDEIEDKNRKFGKLTGSKGMGEITRMARVLRELVDYFNLTMNYVDVVKTDWKSALREAHNNLSDDAKELLEV